MNKETISQIKARLQTITDTTDPYLQTIRDDSRKRCSSSNSAI